MFKSKKLAILAALLSLLMLVSLMAVPAFAEEATTTIESVTWEVGRTGKLTPVAKVAPVELAGATVKQATLNNWQDIQRKRVKIGARVWIRRSNEVIPEIMGRVDEFSEDERDVIKPEVCPSCGAALEERGAHLFCPNRDGCKPQIVMRLSHFASRDAMDIDTFSDKTAAQLVDAGLVQEADQLYGLTREQLCNLDRFGEKKAENLVNAIDFVNRTKVEEETPEAPQVQEIVVREGRPKQQQALLAAGIALLCALGAGAIYVAVCEVIHLFF